MMRSHICHWDQFPPEKTGTGQRRCFFRDATATLDRLAIHVTTLEPGKAAHDPHRHPEEEMIILKEGLLDAFHDGRTVRMEAGSILFLAPDDLHGVTNPGPATASYYVIKWFPLRWK
jgi:quercetin dioxygenase-like cupin family protein